MFQYSGLRIGLFGIIVLSQMSLAILQTPEARAETQKQTTPIEDPAPASLKITSNDLKTDTNNRDTDRNTKINTNDTRSDTDRDTKDITPSKPTVNPPSPQKIVLIQELLQITNQKETAELQLEAMLANMEETLPKILANIMRDRTQLEGNDLLQKVTATTQRMVKRYRELLPTRINFGEITEEISTNLYAKYYTEQELQDLIDFYKTPTGQKAIATLPELTNEALKQSNAILLPEITQLMQEIMEEELGPEPFKPNPDKKGNTSPYTNSAYV